MARVCFCHGLESGPEGYKSRSLVRAGYEVIAPDCRGQDLETRVVTIANTLRAAVGEPRGGDRPTSSKDSGLVVVGSSFGGIAGLLACMELAREQVRVLGLVLCAPALQLYQPPADTQTLTAPAPTIVVHGRGDEIIPHSVSEAFAAREHAFPVELWSVEDGHGLRHSHPVMLRAVARLLGEGC
ncbi:MAG: alpha/beta hydrolase [Nannocystaceae bacterium]